MVRRGLIGGAKGGGIGGVLIKLLTRERELIVGAGTRNSWRAKKEKKQRKGSCVGRGGRSQEGSCEKKKARKGSNQQKNRKEYPDERATA